MEIPTEAGDKILFEITSDDREARREYLKRFGGQARTFSAAMGEAVMEWRSLDDRVGRNERLAYVSGLVYTAITLQILSMKLLLSGQTVAAGNLFRQTLESIAAALLCSSKDLDFLKCFMGDKYSTSNAVRDVRKHRKRLGLHEEGVKVLEKAHRFHHKLSHPTKFTIAYTMSFSTKGLFVGASFDEGKLFAYTKEIEGRTGLAKVFPNLVQAVRTNVAKW
jgi:hypothetical protein